MGLSEVVAEDLVQLNQVGSPLFQPDCEALVEFGAGRLRQRLVGCVADQEVAEAEPVLARELRPVLPDQLLANERGQAWGHLGLFGCECLHGAAVEDLALDRASFEHVALCRLELIQACSQQRLQRRRDDHIALHRAGHHQHLLDEERIAAGRMCDLCAQFPRNALGNQLLDVFLAQGLEPKRDRPPGAAVGELRDGLAGAKDLETLHANCRRQASIGECRIDKGLLRAFDDDGRKILHQSLAAGSTDHA